MKNGQTRQEMGRNPVKRKFTHFLFPLSIKMAVNPRDLYELREKLGQGFGVVSRV